MNRRHFLATGLAASLGSQLHTGSALAAPAGRPEFCFFTKHLQALDFDQMADVAAEMGVDGVEAPVRPKGHVEPERVEDELPRLVAALKTRDLNLTILTSGINEVSDEQRTEAVLRTAASLGVKRFRMRYYGYDLEKPLWPQLETFRSKLKDLVQLCSEIGIQPLYQNHAGAKYAGANVWDMFSLVREYAPEKAAFAFDIRHATVEGGTAWPQHAALVRDHMGAVYFKDCVWSEGKAENCPLGQGMVRESFARDLMKSGYQGPISLHLEYLKGDASDPDTLKSFKQAHDQDFKTLKGWLAL